MTRKLSFEAASEYLRQTLPLMSNHRIPVVPANYAVWFEYVSGCNARLCKALDATLGAGEKIDEELTRKLYFDYLDPADHTRVDAVRKTLRKLIEAMSSSLADADLEVNRFEQSLQECASQISDEIQVEEFRDLVSGLIETTGRMNASSKALRGHLEESRKEADALREELDQVRLEATTDPLTGLANRRGFDQRFKQLEQEEDYQHSPHCLLIADIDNFKSINDDYGHLFGDKIIKVVARAFSNLTKGKDLAARFGGEEFLILLPQTELSGAQAVAELIRSSIERGRVYNPRTGDEIRRVTVSIGVTEISQQEPLQAAISRADDAMFVAKKNGRNRVETAASGASLAAAG